jgi:hypothetical protein
VCVFAALVVLTAGRTGAVPRLTAQRCTLPRVLLLRYATQKLARYSLCFCFAQLTMTLLGPEGELYDVTGRQKAGGDKMGGKINILNGKKS